jgi:DNA polymerase III delta prime subunit
MAHHAYVYAGGRAEGIEASLRYAETHLDLSRQGNPDLTVFEYGLFSVDDARRVGEYAAQAPTKGEQKAIVLAVGRLFHEAQNALLKLFEEPPSGTTLFLIVPAEGILLPTLRSRLSTFEHETPTLPEEVQAFLAADSAEREKTIAKLLLRLKSDKEEEKQAARLDAIRLVEGIMLVAYEAKKNTDTEELDLLLRDLDRFLPILHERAAPYKLIFEHLLLVLPEKLGK